MVYHYFHSNNNGLSNSQTFAVRRDGVLESPQVRSERGRKEGVQEGMAMPLSQKKRKDAVHEGSTGALDLMDSCASLVDHANTRYIQDR